MSQGQAVQLRLFSIELEEGEVCFAPGDLVSGFVVIGITQTQVDHREDEEDLAADRQQAGQFEIIELKLRVQGGARAKGKNRGGAGREQCYLDQELELVGDSEGISARTPVSSSADEELRTVRPGEEKLIKFEVRLPSSEDGLCTSVESKSASVLYSLRVSLTYRNINNEIRRVNAVRGFSVVECVDLARLPNSYFQPATHQLQKKFGLFSCTGGQIRLHFSICRTAFVCGENITIEGRIENRTDRRVDKVAAVLQQVVVVQGSSKEADLNLLDVTDIHEDNLALFVDQGTVLKIERNFALPPLPPSTFSLDCSEPGFYGPSAELLRLGHIPVPVARRRSRRSLGMGQALHQHRFLKVFYQLSVRVKTSGVEVMEINVPVLIGSLPQRKLPTTTAKSPAPPAPSPGPPQNAFTRAAQEAATSVQKGSSLFCVAVENQEGEPTALFMQNRKEAAAKLGQPGETYICNKSQLGFTNRYPFFVNLPTSSKQSRKVSMLASAIRAENSFVMALRQEQSGGAIPAGDNIAKGAGQISKTKEKEKATSQATTNKKSISTIISNKRGSLPPVEVL